MSVSTFIRTLYLGDRACKAITVDGWNSIVRIQVNNISRIRDPVGGWGFYTDEDLPDGFLVFTGVQAFELNGAGHIPNDSINSMEVVEVTGELTTVELSVDSVDADASHHETIVRVACSGLHLEDPARPGVPISE